MKNMFLTGALLTALLPLCATASVLRVASPDEKVSVTIECTHELTYRVDAADECVLAASPISMSFADGTVWGQNPTIVRKSYSSSDTTIPGLFYRSATVKDRYNQLSVHFRGGYGVDFRAYDDGVAYRFFTTGDRVREVTAEQAEFRFAGDYEAIVPYVLDRDGTKKTFTAQFCNSFESTYTHTRLSQLDARRLMFLPLVVRLPSGRAVCITDAALEDYPGMFLNNPDGKTALQGVFAPYPRTTRRGGHNDIQLLVTDTEPYIALTEGARTFPWRAAAIVDDDARLLDCDLAYRLAAPNRVTDTSWIRPGRVAWEWWNNWGIYGVDFRSGINTRTYKYYIDFAAEYGLEYIILDEGWSVAGKADLMQVVPELDLPEIVAYGQQKGVGIILWAGYAAIERDVEGVCRHYARMGVKGFKIDFMDRDDQQMVRFVHRVAQTAARHRLILDLHGMYKPAGLQRTYPNLLNFEGVFGLERTKWTSLEEADIVTYDVTVPFIRQFAGPMDYTQGAMLNGTRTSYRAQHAEPMSPGTRCRQLAQYIVFESPLNMLCDSPVKYRREAECTRFIASVPTVWDQTRALGGQIGQWVAIARRKGDVWYVGALTGWDTRTLTLPLDMLPEGRYTVELFRDGVNADRYAQDYKRETFPIGDARELSVTMAPGGGFAAIITPMGN